jgi:hypothetical protein
MTERAFVLVPLLEIAPAIHIPARAGAAVRRRGGGSGHRTHYLTLPKRAIAFRTTLSPSDLIFKGFSMSGYLQGHELAASQKPAARHLHRPKPTRHQGSHHPDADGTLRAAGEKITMLTCYDASFASLMDRCGVEILLIGDSLGMVCNGHQSTLPVTVAEVAYHTAAVARGSKSAMVLADMPFGSYATPRRPSTTPSS